MEAGSMNEENWRDWARSQRAEVHETARVSKSGSFVKAMVEAFMRADGENTEKLLNAFPDYFKKLHQFHLIIKEKEASETGSQQPLE